MLCRDDGVHVHPEGGHEVDCAEDHVGQFGGEALRLARAVFPRFPYIVADCRILAIFRRDSARPINDRVPLFPLLQGGGELGMDGAKHLRESGRAVPLSTGDGVFVDFFREFVDIRLSNLLSLGVGSETLHIYKALKGRLCNRSLSAPLSLGRLYHILKI